MPSHPMMQAMVLARPGERLQLSDHARPCPGRGELLLRVSACAVCRTDLHVVEGDLAEPVLPLIPGHEIVGRVVEAGESATRFAVGTRVGVPWLGWTCGRCRFCRTAAENLCERARFTGYTRQGGYAQYVVADERFCFALPEQYDDVHAAPLLCAGLIGYRAYRIATAERAGGGVATIGLYGFGAAAHLLAQLAVADGRRVLAYTRRGDASAQAHARSLGAAWAGSSDAPPPEPMDAAIIFAPVGALVPTALHGVRRGGVVVCAGIHMSDIPSFPYADLWQERVIRSVANLTREDGEAFLRAAARVPLRVTATTFPLRKANEALAAVRDGALQGAAVLVPEGTDR